MHAMMDNFKFSPLSSLKSIKFSNTKVINWEVQQINKNFSFFFLVQVISDTH